MTHNAPTYKLLALLGDSLIRSGASSATTTKTLLAISSAAGLRGVTVSVTMGQLIISDSRGEGQLPYTEIFDITPGSLAIQWRSKTEKIIEGLLTGDITTHRAIELLEEEDTGLHPVHWGVSLLGSGLLGIGFSQLLGAGNFTTVGAFLASVLVAAVYRWVKIARAPGIFRYALAGFVAVVVATLFNLVSPVGADVAITVVSSLAAYLAGVAAYAAVQDSIMGWYLSAVGRLLDALMCTAGLVTGVALGIGVAGWFVDDEFRFIRTLDTETAQILDPLLGAALVSLGFALTCGGRKVQLLVLAATGLLAHGLYLVIEALGLTPYGAIALTAVLVGGACVLLSKPLRLTSNAIMTVAFLPLFPGMLIYQGILGTIFATDGGLETLGQALLTTYCLSVGGTAGQYLLSELMWGIRRAQFSKTKPGEKFDKVMVDELNAQDIILPVFSKPFSKVTER